MDSSRLEKLIRSASYEQQNPFLLKLPVPSLKEEKWLDIAREIGNKFSTCVRRQYGAVIIAENGRVAGIGYNGSAPNDEHCNQGGCPRVVANPQHGSSYNNCISIHAEANALLWSDINMRNNSTLIINGPPCFSCAKLIAGSGVKTVVCEYDDDYPDFKKVVEYLEKQNIVVKVSLWEGNNVRYSS